LVREFFQDSKLFETKSGFTRADFFLETQKDIRYIALPAKENLCGGFAG